MQQIGLDAVLNNVPDFTAGINKMNAGVDSFAQNSTKQGGMFAGGFGEIVTGALRKVGELGVQALLAAGRAIKDFVGDSIGLAGDFQANMLQFQSVAGKSVDTKGLEQFRDLFLDIGKRLPVSTSEVQMAAIEMVKGGIDPATIAAGGLEQNIQFAAAAMGGDLVKAAEISSKILGGWAGVNATAADKAEFLTHATDLLTKAANASSTDVEGLSRGIFQSQGIAKAAGIQFDDLVTTLAELAPRFGSSAEAGTSLKNLIARLQPTTANATAAMIDLGLVTENGKNKFFDATGTFIGFQKASELLKDSTKGLTDKQKTLELQMIFGNDAMSAASALSELGAAGYTDMAAALENANGVAAAAALKQQGFNTALDNAKGSVEALQITVGSFLLPVLTDLMNNVIAPAVNTLTDFASALFGDDEAMAKLSPTMQFFATTLSDLSSYFAAVIEDGDYLNDFLDSLPGPIQGVVGGIGMLVAAFGPLQDYINAVVEDGDYLNDFLTDIPKPMQGVVLAVGEVIAMFSSAGDETSDLGSKVNDLSGIWDHASVVITNAMAGYQAIATAVLPIVTKFVDEHGTEIKAFFKTTWDTIIQIVNLALDIYNAIVPPILKAIAGFIEEHSSEIQRILSGAWTIISNLITGTLDTIKGIFKVTLDIINGDWDKAWEDIQGIVDTQIKAAEGIITGFFNIIAGLFDTNMETITKTWTDNWAALKDIVTNTDWAQAGKDAIDGVVKGIEDNAAAIYHALEKIADKAIHAFMHAIGAESPAQEFMPAGAFAIQGIMQGMEGMLPSLNDLIVQTGNDMIAALTKNIEEGGDAIRKQMEKLTEDIKSIAADINAAIADAFGATASVDRQKVANITAIGKLDPKYQAGIQAQINAAEQIARAMNDPKEAAAYFKMRSSQLLELGKLQGQLSADLSEEQRSSIEANIELYQAQISSDLTDKQRASVEAKALALHDKLSTATDEQRGPIEAELAQLLAQLDADMSQAQRNLIDERMSALQDQLANDLTMSQRNLLQAQYDLINDAQNAEMSQNAANAAGQGDIAQELRDRIAALFHGSDLADKLPGILESPMVKGLFGLLDQLTSPVAAPSGYNGVGGISNFSQNTTLNMPIYTNQSPDVLQASLAISGAALL